MRAVSGGRVISVIGAGGKTTLCRALARFSPGRAVYLTTTHMYPPEDLPCLVLPEGLPSGRIGELLERALFRGGRAAVSGTLAGGKCVWPGEAAFAAAASLADIVIVEADGAKGRLMKLHGEREPVIPPETELTVCVLSAAALGLPLGEAAHRAERIGEVLGKRPEDPAGPEDFVRAALAARERSRGEFVAALNRAAPGAGEEILHALRSAGVRCVPLPEIPGAEGRRSLPEEGLRRIHEAFTGGLAAGKENI